MKILCTGTDRSMQTQLCLNSRIPKTINFSFVLYEKLIDFRCPNILSTLGISIYFRCANIIEFHGTLCFRKQCRV